MKNINIREALLELDKRTSCQYDLTTLYEACKLNDEDKNQLVKYIDAYDHPSVIGGFLASKCEALSEELGDDDVSDLKLIDDINCGEDHTLWSLADKLEDDALELKELTEDIAPDEKAAIAGRVREAATGVLVGKLGYEEDFVDNYMTIDVDDVDDNTLIKVEVRAEVDYDGLMTLGQALDPIVKEYDKNAYFEPVTSGIMSAYIRKDQSDDIPDEAAVKEWTDRFNACQTKDDVIAVYRDLIKVRDNNEVTWGTIEAIYDVIDAKMDSLGESLNEALFTVPTDYEDYCPYCATRALKGVGNGRAVCDSCGAEYEVTALGNDKVRLDPLFISEAVTYPNGVECRDDSVDMDKALDYMFGTDRDPDNSHYTEQEKQRAVNYWMDKHDPRPDGKSYMTESTLITPVRNGYHNLWNISDNLVVHDDGGVYHVVQKDGWKNTYIFNSADIEEVNDFLMAHYDVALARANPTEKEDKENARLTDEERTELINIVAMSFETGHFSFDNFEDFKNECSHMTNLEAAWAYYNQLVNMGPAGFYEEFKDVYDFDDMFVSEYGVNESIEDNSEWFVGDGETGHMYKGKDAAQKAYNNLVKSGVKDAVMHPAVEESLVEGDQLDSKFADERYEFAPQDGVTYKSYIGDKEVPYETYEDAKAHLKDDFKITDYRADLQQFLTDNDCHHTVDETTDGRLVISINWGDWKHDHMMVDALVDEFFNSKGLVVKTQKETTEEDGSDTYSAEHYYDIDSLYFKRVPVEEAFDVDKVAKRIARHNEFDNGHVLHNYERMTSAEAEEKARLASIEDPDDIYYVSYDNIMNPSSDIKWKNGQQLTETVDDDAQYGVHSFSQDAIIFRGTEEECGKYIDQHKELWDDAEVYRMTPDDLHYRKEEKLTLSESDDTDILYNTEEPDDYDGIEAGHQFIEDGHEWTLFKQCGETVHLDFDNWAVWWAYRPEIDGDENSTAISGFFVIDVDTGFIDWGPCDTVEEAQQFLQSKVDDYNMDEAIEPEKVFDKDGNEIEPPLGRCKCGKALVAGEDEEPHCPKCGNSISESINVGDKVKVTTPGNNHYDGRTGVVDYAEDGIVTVKFDDDKSPKLNNFDLNQVTKIDESKSIKEDLETFNSLKQKLADGAFGNYVAYDSEYSDFIDALYNDAVAKLEKEYKDLYIEPSIQNGRGSVFASYDVDGETYRCNWNYEYECEAIEEYIAESNNEEEFVNHMYNYLKGKLEDASTGEDDYDDYDESLAKPQELDEGLFDDDFSDEEIASVLGGDTKNDTPDGLETPSETEARLKSMNEETDVTDVATATLEGPEEGAAAGVASLINDAIQDELKTADEYNAISITAKAEGHEDIAAVIDEINTEEHKHIGQLEKALEKVAPNAEAIEVGKVEGEQQLGEVTDAVVVKEGIQPNDLAANVEDAFVRDELDLFVADALSDGSATEETLLTIANDSSNIELEDMKKAINAYKESLDTNNSNSTLNNNSDKDVLEESEVTESWEKIYQSFKTIEKELNQDGEAVTAVIDKMYQDNKDDPDYQKAYDKWASGE